MRLLHHTIVLFASFAVANLAEADANAADAEVAELAEAAAPPPRNPFSSSTANNPFRPRETSRPNLLPTTRHQNAPAPTRQSQPLRDIFRQTPTPKGIFRPTSTPRDIFRPTSTPREPWPRSTPKIANPLRPTRTQDRPNIPWQTPRPTIPPRGPRTTPWGVDGLRPPRTPRPPRTTRPIIITTRPITTRPITIRPTIITTRPITIRPTTILPRPTISFGGTTIWDPITRTSWLTRTRTSWRPRETVPIIIPEIIPVPIGPRPIPVGIPYPVSGPTVIISENPWPQNTVTLVDPYPVPTTVTMVDPYPVPTVTVGDPYPVDPVTVTMTEPYPVETPQDPMVINIPDPNFEQYCWDLNMDPEELPDNCYQYCQATEFQPDFCSQ